MTTRSLPSRRRRTAAAVLSSLAVAGVAGACGSPAASPRPVLTALPVGSRTLALQDAQQLLASLHWPKGWPALSAAVPANLPMLLRGPALEPLTGDLVDVARYAVVPGAPAQVAAALQADRPAGSRVQLTGEETTPGGQTWEFGLSYPAEVKLPQRSLLVQVEADGNRTGVRVDAQVVFRPDKPASEVVPAGITRAVLVLSPQSGPSRTFTLTDPSQIGELVAVVDGLNRPSLTINPGGPMISTSAAQAQATIEFLGRQGGRPLAVVVDHPALAVMGTGNVTLSIGGKAEPVLADPSGSLVAAVTDVTGVAV